MATPSKKKATASTVAPINVTLLAALVAATQDASRGYMFVSLTDSAPLTGHSPVLAEVNGSLTNPANPSEFATRATAEGIAYSAANPAPTFGPAPAAAPAAAAPKPAASKFAIVANVFASLPKSAKGRGIGAVYPFDSLEVGQAFFVPNSAEKPDAMKSMASTISSANLRYSREVPGQMRTNRKNKTVPVLEYLRQFEGKRVEDGAAFGFPGQAGVAVGRVK